MVTLVSKEKIEVNSLSQLGNPGVMQACFEQANGHRSTGTQNHTKHTPATHKGNKGPKKQNKEKTGQHTHQKQNKDQEKKSAQKQRTKINTTLCHVKCPLRFSLL